jgi:hypothetical protein
MTEPVVVEETADSIRVQQAPLPPEIEAELERILGGELGSASETQSPS